MSHSFKALVTMVISAAATATLLAWLMLRSLDRDLEVERIECERAGGEQVLLPQHRGLCLKKGTVVRT